MPTLDAIREKLPTPLEPAPVTFGVSAPPALSLDDAQKIAELCTQMHHRSPVTAFYDLGKLCATYWKHLHWSIHVEFVPGGDVTHLASLHVRERP